MDPALLKPKLNQLLLKLRDEIIHYTQASQMTYIMILAALVGLLGGVGAIGFRALIDLIQNLVLGPHEGILEALSRLPWYWKTAIPVIGGLIVGPLIYFFAREAKGHGVPEVMESVALRNGVIRPRVVLIKYFASAITIGTGGSTGREGPIVQIAAAIGSSLGQMLRVSRDNLKILVGCGAAAGIAATFNAPIAGAFFALEVILGNFALHVFSPMILASVIATAVSRARFGNQPAFLVTKYALVSFREIPLYIILGVLAGLAAIAFVVILYKTEDFFDRLKIPEYLKTALGGLLIGGILLFAPHVYGGSYETIDAALTGNLTWYILVGLFVIKLLATSITLGSGGSGGIFAPSLFLGSMVGGAFGVAVNYFFPTVTASPGAYAMVGMGAVVAGATHAPITAILILFEMTDDYKIILPIMIACTLSTVIAKRLMKDSIYTLKLHRKGVALDQGREEMIMKSFYVSDVMKTDPPTILDKTGFKAIVKTFLEHQEPLYYVVNRRHHLVGTISIHTMKGLIHDTTLQDLVIAHDLVDNKVRAVFPENNLAECMDLFAANGKEHLPVLEKKENRKLIGYISQRDILELYNREILRKDVLGVKFVQEQDWAQRKEWVQLPKDYKVDYVPVQPGFAGKSLRDLNLRAKSNVSVIAIKRKRGGITKIHDVPRPERILENGDVLIVVGRDEDLKTLLNQN